MDHLQTSDSLLGLAVVFAGVLFVISVFVVWRKSKWYEEFVNITARKTSGRLGKRMYKDPRGHYKSFELTLEKLQLKPDDYILEVACGAGCRSPAR